ncbi:mannitol 1-phosphate dehydrogenase [Bimuria novae-zelandiae CBS 107.79]|uniref:Mannitol 1-phosphate dehydrogenase n=1 Tax=Bimuria novae-zelandiae CBS 107.79 TaxID=1447943 RepID=A0A6A5V9J1_9PLEO|nr:mannitol 1-phosphate dehydrogenase [Bimuria novae-zelandiae CBS 107.79]
MAPQKPFNIAIIGGGISGLTLAIALVQRNIPITIYEAAAHFGEIGAGVAFGPNAALAMKRISPTILDAFNKCKTINQGPIKANSWFTIRVGDARKANVDGYVKEGTKVGDALYDVEFNTDWEGGGVYRAHFLDELVKAVPDGVAQFSKRLVNMKTVEDGSGDVICVFADGTEARHDAVIGCDGIKAMTRRWLLGEDNPASRAVFSGKYAYRGLIRTEVATEMLGEEVAGNSNMFFGNNGHLLTFPIEGGKTMNVVAFSSCKEWKHEQWVITTSKDDMHADFSDWGPHVQKIVHAMQKPDIWALFYHLPCDTYYKGRVCLLGDAAHASTPHQGAGAGACVEDTLFMAELLKEVEKKEDLETAFKAFDEVRRPRTQKIVKTSEEAGRLYEFELEGDDLNKIEQNQTQRMRWIWDYDLDGEVDRARRIYRSAVVSQ